MFTNILGSVFYATIANCPIKRALENEREIAKLPKMTAWNAVISYGIPEAGPHSNFTVKAIKALHSKMQPLYLKFIK